MLDTNRRAFLRGRSARYLPPEMRPPWSIEDFVESCSRCDACIEACPQQVLRRGDGGFPAVDFSSAGCVFCGDCAEVCPEKLFQPSDKRRAETAWPAFTARVSDNCLSLNAVMCRSCGDHCESQAIRFRLLLGGRSEPQIDAASCSGCGACVPICPTQSLSVTENTAEVAHV